MSETDAEELPLDYLLYSVDGDEEEEEYEDETVAEEEPIVYDSDDFISGPLLSDESTLPDNILEFHHSFGYNCKKYSNLNVLDDNTLLFESGNILHFFNVETKELMFRRSAMGGGIGAITMNPNPTYSHIAVAENGTKPPIIVYDWPTLDIVCLLKGGTSKSFTSLNYSPEGDLLASQGGEPDYLITVWNWPKSRILLRTKSYVNDVLTVLFSPYVPGQLTTSGVGHIKFWKMARTFTGLKLKGEIGRFGKTEYSDIVGVYPMPDEKVISGCYWGNFLIWDAGLIKFEVCRKLRKKCHDAPIVQFHYKDGELWTIAMDGRVRVWFYDTIDQADPPDDDRFVQTEPIYDFCTPGAQFMCIRKQNLNEQEAFFFAQDGNGGIWKIDLSTEREEVTAPVQLMKCHAGPVMDVAACPWGPYLASLGQDGRLHIYHFLNKQLLLVHKFPAKGVALIWLPLAVEPSGNELILGFDDGNLRLVVVTIQETGKVKLALIQITKPHNRPITAMSLNESGSLLITGGEDCTIFVYQVVPQAKDYTRLVPIGLVPTPEIVTCLSWHREINTTIIVGCIHGEIMQVDVPTEPQPYTLITYRLMVEPKYQRFITYKAQIRRDIKLREIALRKEEELEIKREQMEKIKKENPGLEIDEEVFLADSESEEVLEPLHIPDVPNRIYWIQHTVDDTLWVSMGGFDAGYIYEFYIDQKSEIPSRFLMVYDADDIEINAFVYNNNKQYLIFAMEDGSIRLNRVNPDDFRDLSDYWRLSMHDNYNGLVSKMCFSFDERHFFTCGHDGNIFSYKFDPEEEEYTVVVPNRIHVFQEAQSIPDVTDYATLSLEETIVKAEVDRKLKVANRNKAILREKLEVLKNRFEKVLERNFKLLPTQVIPREELELDWRITENLKEKLDADLALVKRKLAFPVEKSEIGMKKLLEHFTDPLDCFPICVKAINTSMQVKTLRQRKLKAEFFEMHDIVDQKIIEAELKGRPPERPPVFIEVPPPPEKKEKQLEYFLMGLSPSTIEYKLGAKLSRLLRRYRNRKIQLEHRQQEWDDFNILRPADGVNHPDDEVALLQAIDTIGDFKLKSAEDYKVPKHLRESTVKKYKQLLNVRQNQFEIRHNFNKRVYEMRKRKVKLVEYLVKLNERLEGVRDEIPERKHIDAPEIPKITEDDFPERNLEVVRDPKTPKVEDHDPLASLVPPPVGDLLEKEVLTSVQTLENFDMSTMGLLQNLMNKDIKVVSQANFGQLLRFAEDDDIDTPWEKEMKALRLTRKLFEQQQIVTSMQDAMKDFDDSIHDLRHDRFQVLVDAKFIDIHLLTLHQELIILRDFESFEDFLSDRVRQRIEDLLDMKDLITELNNKADGHKREIDRLSEKEKELQQQFFTTMADNKFYDFLRRIFKKKYRPPKVHNPDEESSSSESSSSSDESEEADAGSVDSRDIGPIRLDESVCPKGCDQAMYDLTFELRNQRHGVELEIKEQNRSIDNLRKELDLNFKKSKVIENNLKVSQDELEAFQQEKQCKLNQVICTVVLKLNQLQHLISDNEAHKVADTLVFSKVTLSKLYKRVGQLYNETLLQKAKHKTNILHLSRMKTDCKHMQKQIAGLKEQIKETLIIKFGRVIPIDDVEEAFLRRLVFDLRMSMLDIRGLYEHELRVWREQHAEKQTEVAEAIRNNTSRLELLGLLNHEKTDLVKLVSNQDRKRDHLDNVVDIAETYKTEIKRLVSVVKEQTLQLEDVKEEIRMLRTKGLPPKPIKPFPPKREEIEIAEDLYDWETYPEEVAEEEYVHRPSVIALESEQAAREIIFEMLNSLETNLSRLTIESIIEQILAGVMTRSTVKEIIEDLLCFIPIEPTDEQHGIIEMTAEQLYAMQEVALTESEVFKCSEDLLEEILDNIMLKMGEPHEVMARLVSNLVENLPIDFILKKESMQAIINRIIDTFPDMAIDKQSLAESVMSLSPESEEMRIVLNEILEEVFGTGIDYLYHIT